jgi:hypothetical protein
MVVVYVRGFNEPDKDLGKWAVDPLVKKLSLSFKVRTATLPYSARPDRGSLEEGNKNLVEYLEREHQEHPDSCFVLVGYSLGADVIQDSLGAGPHVVSASVGLKIRAIELFGNPYRRFNSPRSTPAEYRGRTVDTCNANDPFCDPASTVELDPGACGRLDFGGCLTPPHLSKAYVRNGLAESAAAEATCIVATGQRCSAAAATQRASHMVVSGDTLWDLAVTTYGDGTKWQMIYAANRSVIEAAARDHGYASSRNGDLIFPGTALVIPPAA